MALKEGAKVNLLGVHQSVRVPCDDEDCPYEHFENRPEIGRYHYEGERTGVPGIFQGYENFRGDPKGKLVLFLPETGGTVSADPEDVEEVS